MTAADPPVLLLHGFATSSARTWGETGWIDLLQDAGRRCCAIDLLGHGEAPKPHDPAAYDRLEDLVLEATARRARRRRRLLARGPHAAGAGVGPPRPIQPDRGGRRRGQPLPPRRELRRCSPTPWRTTAAAPAEAMARRWPQYFRGQADEPGNDRVALAACLRRPTPRRDHRRRPGRIVCPVLVVIGDRDFAGPADPLVERLPDARMVVSAQRRPLRHAEGLRVPRRRPRLPRRVDRAEPGRVGRSSCSPSISTASAPITRTAFPPRSWRPSAGSTRPNCRRSETWNFHEWGLTDDDFDRLHRQAVLVHRMFRDMPVVPGAAEALWRLSDAGVWIRIVTHRLYANWGHAVAVADTVEWLDAVGIPYRDLCFLGRKPAVEADLYVEDAPHNVASSGRPATRWWCSTSPTTGPSRAPGPAGWRSRVEAPPAWPAVHAHRPRRLGRLTAALRRWIGCEQPPRTPLPRPP